MVDLKAVREWTNNTPINIEDDTIIARFHPGCGHVLWWWREMGKSTSYCWNCKAFPEALARLKERADD